MSLPLGTRCGPFELLAVLGAGGMGEVYRAKDTRLGREVAVKILPADVSADADRLARFEQEARSASALNHPNIVTVHEVGTFDSIPSGDLAVPGTPAKYIAMELVEGRTLRELLASGPLPVRRLLPMAAQVADGLAKAHGAGIVHRDLKPENVMVNRDGFVKILDFGLAVWRPLDAAGREQTAAGQRPMANNDLSALPTVARLTTPGMVLGTVGYMSPEQASGEEIDYRSDQFSFGSILYEMATGKRAFQKKTAIETLSAIIREDPEPIAAVTPTSPPPLRWIVERCLAKDREDRYTSTQDLARDVKQTQAHLSEVSGTEASVEKPKKRRRTAWAAAIVALLAVGLADVALRLRGGSTPPKAPAVLKRVTFGPGLEDEPTFSPDGKFLAYTTDERGNLDVVVQPLAGGETIRVAATDADEAQPAWSPDGSQIAFVSARDHGGRLGIALGVGPLEPYVNTKLGDIFLVPALGGTPVKLVGDAYYPAWSPDGTRIAYVARRDRRVDIWTVPAAGGTPARLTNDENIDYEPAWSPDAKWIAYGSGPTQGPHNLRVVAAAGGTPRTMTKEFVYVTRPSWSADGGSIFFSGEREGISNIWRVPFSASGAATAAARVTTGQGQDANASLSRDGTRLAFATVRNEFNVWELTLATGKLRAVTSGSGLADYPQPSPDGRTLLVNSNRTGQRAAWSVDLNGRFLSQMTPGQGLDPSARWSPDGRQVAYEDGEHRVRIQAVGSLASRDTGVIDMGGFLDWSPDGRFLATANHSIRIQSIEDGKTRAIAAGELELNGPTWSPDGKQIAYFTSLDPIRELWVAPVDGRAPRQLTRGEEDSHPAWSPKNPDEILFLRDHKRLAVMSVSTGQIRWLPGYSEGSYILDYPAWSPDGTKIYFSVSRKSGDIYVLEGF